MRGAARQEPGYLGGHCSELVLVQCVCVRACVRAHVCLLRYRDSALMMCVAYFHLMGLFHIHLTSCNEKPGDLDKKFKIKHRNCTWDYFVLF